MIRAALWLLLLLLALPACTAQQIRLGLEERERNLCAQGPEVQYQECIERIEHNRRRDQAGG